MLSFLESHMVQYIFIPLESCFCFNSIEISSCSIKNKKNIANNNINRQARMIFFTLRHLYCSVHCCLTSVLSFLQSFSSATLQLCLLLCRRPFSPGSYYSAYSKSAAATFSASFSCFHLSPLSS